MATFQILVGIGDGDAARVVMGVAALAGFGYFWSRSAWLVVDGATLTVRDMARTRRFDLLRADTFEIRVRQRDVAVVLSNAAAVQTGGRRLRSTELALGDRRPAHVFRILSEARTHAQGLTDPVDVVVAEVASRKKRLEGLVAVDGTLTVFTDSGTHVFDVTRCKPFVLTPGRTGAVVRLWLEADAQIDGPPLAEGSPLTFSTVQIDSRQLCDDLNAARATALTKVGAETA